ncbi:hypothetical protein [Lactococcus allomyrinae]|uniref:hypothetical protein n=1 Tax=Lactococcus allomyrinae TaxID=2419773 RepID=UPI0013C4BBD2|nr:hypothetical protein [Lactococcus allomyrinae]
MSECKKIKYSNLGALYALVSAQETHNDYRPIRKYFCKECQAYHLTSKQHIHYLEEMGTLGFHLNS